MLCLESTTKFIIIFLSYTAAGLWLTRNDILFCILSVDVCCKDYISALQIWRMMIIYFAGLLDENNDICINYAWFDFVCHRI